MTNYTVVVTGTWNMDIEANTREDAERLAYIECLKNDLDVGGMNLEFEAFNEGDE
jgi:hypothetical protein